MPWIDGEWVKYKDMKDRTKPFHASREDQLESKRMERNKYQREYYARRRAEGMPPNRAGNKKSPCPVCSTMRDTRFGDTCRGCRPRHVKPKYVKPKALKPEPKQCFRCGCNYTPQHNGVSKYCSTRCRYAHKGYVRRSTLGQLPSDAYSLKDLHLSSDGLCGICSEPVDLDLPGTHRMGPSVDHIIPLSRGGTDLISNVQIAHLVCNCRKGNRTERTKEVRAHGERL